MGFAFTLNARILETSHPPAYRQREEVPSVVPCPMPKEPHLPLGAQWPGEGPGAGLTCCWPASPEALPETMADCLLQAQSLLSRLLIALFMA